jgi:RecA-family ATPase
VENPRFIGIDVLERIRPKVKSRDTAYTSDYQSLKQLQGLAAKYRVGVAVVHHQRKAAADDKYDTASGTLGLTGAADAVLILEKAETRRKLSGNGRDLEEFEIIIDPDEHMRWKLIGDAAEVSMSDERRGILELLRGVTSGMSIRDIATALDKDYNTVKVGLWRMRKSGEIVKENSLYKMAPEQNRFDDDVI